jgi:hypothetical protein
MLLTGPIWLVSVVLAVAGWLKLKSPQAPARAFRAARLPFGPGLVRAFGLFEITVAALSIWVSGTIPLFLLAGSYWLFASYLGVALVRRPDLPCGCFGGDEAPPSRAHLVFNLVAGVTALSAALVPDPPPGLGSDLGVDSAILLLAAAAAGFLAIIAMGQAGLVGSPRPSSWVPR